MIGKDFALQIAARNANQTQTDRQTRHTRTHTHTSRLSLDQEPNRNPAHTN